MRRRWTTASRSCHPSCTHRRLQKKEKLRIKKQKVRGVVSEPVSKKRKYTVQHNIDLIYLCILLCYPKSID